MTVENTQLGLSKASTTYGPFGYGSHAGEPVVEIFVSENDDKKMSVRGVDSMVSGYGWKRKLESGLARLQYSAENILSDEHEEGVVELSRILGARFVDFEIGEKELNSRIPPRDIQNVSDYYRVFVPRGWDFDRDILEFYSNTTGSSDFIFKVDSYNDDEYIKEVSRDFGIRDYDVWLYPKGRKVKTVSGRMEMCQNLAKSNSWNVSPRLGVTLNYEEE